MSNWSKSHALLVVKKKPYQRVWLLSGLRNPWSWSSKERCWLCEDLQASHEVSGTFMFLCRVQPSSASVGPWPNPAPESHGVVLGISTLLTWRTCGYPLWKITRVFGRCFFCGVIFMAFPFSGQSRSLLTLGSQKCMAHCKCYCSGLQDILLF